ncbi:MAG: 50S ribosomal protein L7, partial [Oscillospiraceae bacterium]|nr:50S ribosomal protein L7 [Oscillospiraceae bacterium]
GGAVGRSTCAVLALTDIGLAAAVLKKLPQEEYGDMTGRLERRAEKTYRRRKAQREKAKAKAKGKPWASPPREQQP